MAAVVDPTVTVRAATAVARRARRVEVPLVASSLVSVVASAVAVAVRRGSRRGYGCVGWGRGV